MTAEPRRCSVVLVNPGADLKQSMGIYRFLLTAAPPMGIASIAAVLRQADVPVALEDAFVGQETAEALARRIARSSPTLVGISMLTGQLPWIREFVPLLRRESPETRIVAGNVHANVFAHEVLEEGLADMVVRGEGEEPMRRICERIRRGEPFDDVPGLVLRDGEAIREGEPAEVLRDLDALPFPAWDLLDLSRYRPPAKIFTRKRAVPVLINRGCPFHCRFCSQVIHQPGLRKRSISRVLDEIEWDVNVLGIGYLGISDANFPLEGEQALEFAEGMIERGLHERIAWFTETRVDLVERSVMARLAEAGLYMVMLGLESGDQRILDRTGKGTTLEQARKATSILRELNLMSLGFFILGLPGESESTCRRTLAFAKSLSLDLAKFNRAVPYPGSSFFEDERAHLADCAPERFSSWHALEKGEHLAWKPEGMEDRALVRLQARAMLEFYLRPTVLWKAIRHLF